MKETKSINGICTNEQEGHFFYQIYDSITAAYNDITGMAVRRGYTVEKIELGRTWVDFIKVTYWVPHKENEF